MLQKVNKMDLIDQDYANEIAQSEKLVYPITRKMFECTQDESDEMESDLYSKIKKETKSHIVAWAIATFLPLLLENKAISQYLTKTNQQFLRNKIPEILTAGEAALYANAEKNRMISPEEMKTIVQTLKRYQKSC
jgi:hypothetical protein